MVHLPGAQLAEDEAEAPPPPLQGVEGAGLVHGQGVEGPVAALARVLSGPGQLHEGLVQRQVVADRVLPAGVRLVLVVGELILSTWRHWQDSTVLLVLGIGITSAWLGYYMYNSRQWNNFKTVIVIFSTRQG